MFQDGLESSVNEYDVSPSVTKKKEPNRTRTKARERFVNFKCTGDLIKFVVGTW